MNCFLLGSPELRVSCVFSLVCGFQICNSLLSMQVPKSKVCPQSFSRLLCAICSMCSHIMSVTQSCKIDKVSTFLGNVCQHYHCSVNCFTQKKFQQLPLYHTSQISFLTSSSRNIFIHFSKSQKKESFSFRLFWV